MGVGACGLLPSGALAMVVLIKGILLDSELWWYEIWYKRG